MHPVRIRTLFAMLAALAVTMAMPAVAPAAVARVATVGKFPTIAPTNAPTSDPTTVAKSSDGRYRKSAGALRAAQAKFCADVKLIHDWNEGVLDQRWSQDALVAMFQSRNAAERNGCAWAQ